MWGWDWREGLFSLFLDLNYDSLFFSKFSLFYVNVSVCLAFLTREVQVHIHPLILCLVDIKLRSHNTIEPDLVKRDRHSIINKVKYCALSKPPCTSHISLTKTNVCNLVAILSWPRIQH